jgi:hypothetical protein
MAKYLKSHKERPFFLAMVDSADRQVLQPAAVAVCRHECRCDGDRRKLARWRSVPILKVMQNLRHIHEFMTDRRRVLLDDGRTGRIVRVDTTFPAGDTTVSVWTECTSGPSVAKVDITRVVGPAPRLVSA